MKARMMELKFSWLLQARRRTDLSGWRMRARMMELKFSWLLQARRRTDLSGVRGSGWYGRNKMRCTQMLLWKP